MKRRSKPGLLRRALAGLRGALTENIGLKSVCLLCALLLVAYQRSQTDERARTITFTLDVQLPPQEARRQLTTSLPPHVNVTVQGSSGTLDDLATSSPRFELDLRDGDRERIDFNPELFEIPPGLTIRAIDPPTLELAWEDVILRQLRVQSAVTGRVADGHEVAKQTVEPELVSIQGPSSAVRSAQLARVAPFDISGLSAGVYKRQLALDPAPNRTRYVDAELVTVTVEIKQRMVSVNFPKLTVEIVGMVGAKVTPAKVDVAVRGAPEVVRALQPEMVVPRVNATNIDLEKHGSVVLPVEVELTRASAEIQPPTVKLSW